ncbi:MAG: hypothetical protein ABFS17_05365, partial [Chloroflexota bacterium]
PAGRLALLQAVSELAVAQQMALYIVGGFVRDLLLDRPSVDFDLVVEGDAIALGKALSEKFGGRVVSHKRFGTAKWQLFEIHPQLTKVLQTELKISVDDFPETLDLVTARREFYTYPTALPTVERGSIKLDLHRRDFTINTLAMRLDGQHYGDLYDYWGGLADLQNGLVRVLHSLSFVDDPTRILRAVRFEQRFGFRIGERTRELLDNALSLLERVSGDRLRHEMKIILEEPKWKAMLGRLAELGVFKAIDAEIPWDQATETRIELGMKSVPPVEWDVQLSQESGVLPISLAYILWLVELTEEQAKATSKRLRLPGWLRDTLLAVIRLKEDQSKMKEFSPSEMVNRFEAEPELALFVFSLVLTDDSLTKKIERYFLEWRKVHPHTSGDDLRQRKIPPGPMYGKILDQLRAAWLDGKIRSKKEENKLLEALLNEDK